MIRFAFTALMIGSLSGMIGITMEYHDVTSHIAYYFLGVGTIVLCNVVGLVSGKKNTNNTRNTEPHTS
jgi:hypothetical protein